PYVWLVQEVTVLILLSRLSKSWRSPLHRPMMRKPEDDRNCKGQRNRREQKHGCRLRFRRFISRGEKHDNGGQWKAAANQRLSRKWTADVQQMQESEKH